MPLSARKRKEIVAARRRGRSAKETATLCGVSLDDVYYVTWKAREIGELPKASRTLSVCNPYRALIAVEFIGAALAEFRRHQKKKA